MIELVKNTKIDFMGLKKYAFSFSAMLVILGIVGTVQIYRGKSNLGIDLAGGTEIQIKFQKPFAMDRIRALLAKAGHSDATLQQVTGENILFLKLRKDAELAMLVSALAIILYLAWRFEFKFGVAAAIATFHDIFSIVGIFWVLGIEMDLLFITALLTIGGYSLTDTVVVFDRIREN
ncbi:MAG: protein translocase subunit SecF, partial [Deltaproteobacteria bacterium 21-66-5]